VVQGSRVPGHAFCFGLSVFLLFTSSSARLFSLGSFCFCFRRELLDIPRLLGALVWSLKSPALVFLVLVLVFEVQQDSRILFSLGCGFSSKCPEVFWFHPAEFGQMDLVLLLNTSFLLFTVISSLVSIGGLGGCGGGWYYCLLSCVLVRCQVYAVRFGRFSRRCCMFECVRRLMVLLYCYLGIFDVSGSCISLWSLLSLVLSSWTCTEPDGITVWCCMHF
jgi:hypothetical protein